MRRLVLAVFGVMTLSAGVRAEFVQGSQTAAIFGGAGGSSSMYDYDPGNQDNVTGGGGAWGAQYFYYVRGTPAIGIGVDFASSPNGDRDRDDLLSGFDSTARLKSNVGLVIAKLAFPRGLFRPYLFGGVGFHSSTQKLTARPRGATTWSGGGTESRLLIDEDKNSAALGYGIGIDIFPTERFFMGLELRGVWLAGLETDANATVRAAGFTDDSQATVHQGNIFLRLGLKF